MASGVLYDGTRCIGCRACSVACKSWNRKPDDPEKKVSVEGGIEGKTSLSAKTLTFMRYRKSATATTSNGPLPRYSVCTACTRLVRRPA